MGTTYVLPKLLYVSLYSLYGSAIAYIAIFYDEELKRTPQEIGLLLATPYFIQIISSPLWTMVADKYPHFQGRLMALLTLLGGASILALVPLATMVTTYSGTVIFWLSMTLAVMFSFFGSPLVSLVDSSVLKLLGDHKVLYGNQRLWGSISNGFCIFTVGIMISSIGIRSAFYLFGIGMVSLMSFCLMTKFHGEGDTHVEDGAISEEQRRLLSKSEPRGNYAYNPQQENASSDFVENDDRQSLISNRTGYAPPPFFSQHYPEQSNMWRRDSTNTLLLDDDEDSRRYHQLLQTMTTSTTYAAMDAQHEANRQLSHLDQEELPSLGLALSHIPTVETSLAAFALVGQQQTRRSISLEKSSLKSLRVQTFLVMVLLFGIAYAAISQLLFILYKNDLGMKPSLMGLTGPLAGFSEVMTFWFSKKLFDRYSVTTLTTVAHVLFVIRNLVFMSLKRNDPISIAAALGLQIVNGFCYATMWSTAVTEVDSFFPEDQRAMAQGILAAIFSGGGYGFGSVISGVIYDRYGYQHLLGASASIALLGLTLFYIGRWRSC